MPRRAQSTAGPIYILLMARVACCEDGLNRPLGGVATSSMARRRAEALLSRPVRAFAQDGASAGREIAGKGTPEAI